MNARRILFFGLVIVSLSALSCKWLSRRNYNVDKTSPNGVYRVKVDVRVEDEGDVAGHFTEQGKIQVLRGQETIHSREWSFRDNWESTFIDNNPVIEWVGNNTLRMGRDNSSQPFTVELIVSNKTDERLKHIGVGCGKFESFDVFDVTPGGQVVLRPSPGLNPQASGEFSLGYVGETESGRRFTGAVQQKQLSNSPSLQITISAKDLP